MKERVCTVCGKILESDDMDKDDKNGNVIAHVCTESIRVSPGIRLDNV